MEKLSKRSSASQDAAETLLMLQTERSNLDRDWGNTPLHLPLSHLYECSSNIGWKAENPIKHADCGLSNLGSTSFLNAVLQALLHSPTFLSWIDGDFHHLKDCSRTGRCVTCSLISVRQNMCEDSRFVTPVQLLNCVIDMIPNFVIGSEHDAHQFLSLLLLKLHNEFLERFDVLEEASWLTTPVFRCFGGCLITNGVCCVCENPSKFNKPFVYLKLEVTDNGNVQDCINNFFSKENILLCPDCDTNVFCFKMGISMFPRVLILKLDRFDKNNRKVGHNIHINQSIELKGQVQYSMSSVVLHCGQIFESGYYETLLRCPNGSFKKCHDSQIYNISPTAVEDPTFLTNSYILFYEYTALSKAMKEKISQKKLMKTSEMLRESSTNDTSCVSAIASPKSMIKSWKVTPQKVHGTATARGFSQKGILKPRSLYSALNQSEYVNKSRDCSTTATCSGTDRLSGGTEPDNMHVKKSSYTVKLVKNPFDVCFEFSPAKFRFFTSLLPEHFDALFNLLGGDTVIGHLKYVDKRLTPKKKKNKIRVTPRQKLLLTLVRLRRGIPLIDLAQLFEIGKSQAGYIFNAVTKHMYLTFRSLDDEMLLSAKDQKRKKPLPFKGFKNLRIILDGVEFPIQRPSNFLQQGNTYSSYKSTNTVVFIIGISCYGGITFFSPGYEGSMSDKEAVLQSGLLERLEHGDSVMTDRGFEIASELQKIGVNLIKPPLLGSRKKFTSEEEVLKNQISSARIYVEHAIRKIKEFRLLRGVIPLTMLPKLPELVLVAAYLTNFRAPTILQPLKKQKKDNNSSTATIDLC